MSTLKLSSITKTFNDTKVIKGVDLEVEKGEFVVFVGPSGCGKSTLLRIIAGLETVSSGDIIIDGKVVNNISAANRGCAMVFQSYALYPHMSVYQNMAFGLENAKVPKAEIDNKVTKAAKMLRLDELLNRKPTQLSGGQRQRVAIGRAIVREPKVFLFDEPLSNLDAELRVSMRAEIRDLHQRIVKSTMIYVTHDQVEAMTMADRIVVLRAGLIEQVGTPEDLYEKPMNTFVAGFIGSPKINLFDYESFLKALVHAESFTQKLPKTAQKIGFVGIRPEHFHVVSEHATNKEKADGTFSITVKNREYLGATALIQGMSSQNHAVEVLTKNIQGLHQEDTLTLGFDMAHIHLFNLDGIRI